MGIAPLLALALLAAAPPMVVVREADVKVEQPPPHNGAGMSTAYRLSDAAPKRSFEFRKRVMHRGSTIGLHVLDHDEIYYALSGRGEVTSDGVTKPIGADAAAYLYEGANVGIKQVGHQDLVLIIAYPLAKRTD